MNNHKKALQKMQSLLHCSQTNGDAPQSRLMIMGNLSNEKRQDTQNSSALPTNLIVIMVLELPKNE